MKLLLILGSDSFLAKHFVSWAEKNLPEDIKIGKSSRHFHDFFFCDLLNHENISGLIKNTKPSFILNCAGLSNFLSCEQNSDLALQTNTVAINSILDSIVKYSPDTKFANLGSVIENNEKSFYGLTKKYARGLIEFYVKNHNICGKQIFLCNTSSNTQSDKFIVPKIIKAARDIKQSIQLNQIPKILTLGNLNSEIKLIHADAASRLIWIAMNSESKENIVIEGSKVKIKDLVKIIFEKVGIPNWEKYVVSSPDLFREDFPTEIFGVKLTDLDSVEKIIDKCLIEPDLAAETILAD